MNPTRVLIADNHAMVRAGVRALLAALPDVEVVAEAADGREAVKLVGSSRPDIVLMDIAMPRMNGLDAAARIVREYPCSRVLMVSMHVNEEYVVRALQSGAVGFLVKDCSPRELALALAAIARGETYLTPSISRSVVDDYMRRVGAEGSVLTPRQREVLQLITEGKTTREIAALLCLSIKTVESHRQQLMDRLDAHDIAGLVRYAIRSGLVPVDI